jgi:hypothetical protein
MRNPICNILFISILAVLLFLVLKWIFNLIMNIINKEGFLSNRETRIKIFQSDEILDPDETPNVDDYDPDEKTSLFDPDQQSMLDDEETSFYQNRK